MDKSPENVCCQRANKNKTSNSTIFTELKKLFLVLLVSFWKVITKVVRGIGDQLLKILLYLREFYRTWRLARQFKGRMPLGLLGNIPFKAAFRISIGLNDFLAFAQELRLGQYWLGFVRHIFVSTPEDIQVFLSNKKNNGKGVIYSNFDNPGLATLSGPVWKTHRRIIQPSFHKHVLETFVEIFDRESKKFVQRLASKANGLPFNVEDDIQSLIFQIVMDSIMDSGDVSKTAIFVQEISQLFHCFGRRIIYPWLYPSLLYYFSPHGRTERKARKVIVEFINEAIQKKRQELEQISRESDGDYQMSKKIRRCFLTDLLIEQMKGAPITEKEMIEEVIQFFMAGVDTAHNALQSAMYHLAHNRHIQDKMLEEIREIFSVDSTVTNEKLHQMRYIDMVLKEVLRISPPGWFTTRTAGEDTPLPCGLIIPRGVQVLVSIKTLHMDPKIYPNPEVFDPERFCEERKSNIGPYDYIPFMKGPRTCIGYQYATMELLAVLAHLIWNYEILPDPTYEPEYNWRIVTYAENGTRIALRPRNNNM